MTEKSAKIKTFPKHATWFRMYHVALDDPKVQRLEGHVFKFWINVLCLACRHGGNLPGPDHIAFSLRMSAKDAESSLATLIDVGLIDILPDRSLRPHNWDRRQFVSDAADPTVAERMRRYRKRHKRNKTVTQSVTRTVTASDSVSVSESEYNNNRLLSSQEKIEDSICRSNTRDMHRRTRDGGDA